MNAVLAGRTLGEFVLRERIGEGGFGEVFRAYQPLLAREAVVKILHTRHTGSPVGSNRFLREARLASRIDHPYAAHIYAFGLEKDGLIWIAMEYVRGQPLDAHLRQHGPLPLDELVPFLDRLAEVVHTAHEQRIVHRDIKPANVMVIQRAGRILPKLLDLGIAKLVEDAKRAPQEADEPGDLILPASEEETAAADRAAVNRANQTLPVRPDADAPALTRTGAIMGSPPYMAPELWRGSQLADARSDLYALGVLAFEALTGRRPFVAASATALAQAHAEQPVPPVGGNHPTALDEVFRKALAKDPALRHASALELAAAFRAAAGVDRDAEGIARLGRARAQRWLASAPQPLADAVAALQGARNPHQARDALRGVVRTLSQWLAICGLAAIGHVRPDREALAEVGERLRALRRSEGAEEDWLGLAAAACAPFAARPDTHPLPALVRFLAADAHAALERLAATGWSGPSLARGDEVRTWLVPALGELDSVLEALEPLLAYPLVVHTADGPELWSGLRRGRREPAGWIGAPPVEGRPLLTDAGGRPRLALWPLAQLRSPTAGAEPEIFLFDGIGRRGARLVALPAGFHADDPALPDWLSEQLLEDSADGHGRVTGPDSPYQGLAAYTAEQAPLYFGREQETEEALNRLVTEPFLGVVGPSGAGKSSFVHAGIVPSLPPGGRTVTLRPGMAPRVALAARLAALGVAAEEPEAAAAELRERARAGGFTALVIVDQLEELFTQGAGDEEQAHVARTLAALGRSAADPVRVIVTIRDDFLMRAQALAPFRPLFGRGLLLIGVPAPADLQRIVTEPARHAGHEFDDDSLPGEMVRAVAGQPGALPLLSFTAHALWERRDRQFRRLTRSAYDAMGGVGGALARHADDLVARSTREEQRLVREIFRQLVTAEGTRAVMLRRELVGLLAHGEADRMIDRLVDARLLVTGDDDQVEIVHEALLAAWPRLAEWRREDAEGARLRDELRAAARQWDARGRPGGLLWRDEAVVELEAWLARHAPQLTDVEWAFARASAAVARRSKRVRAALVSSVMAILAVAVVVLLWSNANTRAARREAEAAAVRERAAAAQAQAQVLAQLEERGRQALLDGRAPDALHPLAEAFRQGAPRTPALRFMLARAMQPLRARVGTLVGHDDEVVSAQFSPDGATILTASADGTARLWDAQTQRPVATLGGCPGKLQSAAFDPAGQRIAAECDDGVVRIHRRDGTLERALTVSLPTPGRGNQAQMLIRFTADGASLLAAGDSGVGSWDVAAGEQEWWSPTGSDVLALDLGPGRLLVTGSDAITRIFDDRGRELVRMPTGFTLSAAFSPDARHVVTTSLSERVVKLWDARSGRLERTLLGHSDWVDLVRFSPDGKWIATAARDHSIRLWRSDSGELVHTLATGKGVANGLTFDPAGRHLAAALSDGKGYVWNVATGTRLLSLQGHRDGIRSIAFSPDGARVLTASSDRTAMLWSPARSDIISVLPAHPGFVYGAQFSRDGRLLFSHGQDGTAKVWELGPSGARLAGELALPARIEAGAAADDGSLFVVGDASGTVRAWSGRSADRPVALSGHAGGVRRVALRGGLVASGGADEVVLLSDAVTGAERARLPYHQGSVGALAFNLDGSRLVTGDGRGAVRLWATEPARLLATLEGHRDEVLGAVFTTGGEIVTVSADRTARVWSPAGKPLRVLAGHSSLVNHVAVDGGRVLTTSIDRTARLWDLASGKLTAELRGHANLVLYGGFSPDGTLVATVGDDGTARVWDPTTGRELATLEGHAGPVWTLAFSRDGSRLVTGGADGSLVLWEIPSVPDGEVLPRASCLLAGTCPP